MCNYVQIIFFFIGILLLNVVPVIGGCYYEYQYAYYDCYTNVGVIVGVVIGCLFGLLVIVFIVIIICCQVKTRGIRGHLIQPANVSTAHTTQEKVSPPVVNRYASPNEGVYLPPPTQYSPPPAYPGGLELRPA